VEEAAPGFGLTNIISLPRGILQALIREMVRPRDCHGMMPAGKPIYFKSVLMLFFIN